MHKLFFLATLLLSINFSWGVTMDKMYPVSEIPEALKEGAHAVVRLNDTHIIFTAKGEATKVEKVAVTILDNDGTDFTELVIGYDRYTKIKILEGNLYDKNGNKIRSLPNKDIKDQSAISSISLFEDNRVRFASLTYNEFPFTVEFTTEEKLTAVIYTLKWMPVEKEYTSLQKGILTVVTKSDLPFNYWSSQSIAPVVTKNSAGETYMWTLDTLRPVKLEAFGPPAAEQFTSVSITPVNYKIENYEATINTWEDMSRFYYEINKGRDNLDNGATDEIRSQVKNCKDKKDSIRTLYRYLQNHTRYVSVQLGIGGFQCYDANYVNKYNLGDCKALSNYMKALLKAVGINSYQAFVYAGYSPVSINTQHVSDSFNHAILFVPCEKDTIWLECTSQIEPFAYVSDFTQNRYCLPLSEQGSGLVKIPLSKEYINGKKIVADLFIDSVGKLSGKVDVLFTGTYSDGANYYFTNSSDKKVEEWLDESLQIRNGSLTSTKLTQSGRNIPSAEITCSYSLEHTFAALSNRAFLKASIFNKMSKMPNLGEIRKFNMINYFPYSQCDSIVYHLPENFSVESYMQDGKKEETELGNYSLQLKLDAENHTLCVVRKYSLNEFNLRKEKEDELKSYFSFVYKADCSEFVLVKK